MGALITEGSAPVIGCAVEPLMEESSPNPEPEVGLFLDSSEMIIISDLGCEFHEMSLVAHIPIFICGRGGGDRFIEGSLLIDTLLGPLESGTRLVISGAGGYTSARASLSRSTHIC